MLKISKNQSYCLYVTAFSVLLLLLSTEVRFPIGVVPITLQTFVATLLGLQLDKRSAISTCVTFIIVKMLTLPVLVYPAFGYIIGMSLTIPIMCYIRQSSKSRNVVACIVGYFVTTTIGSMWLYHFLHSWKAVWLHGIAPFVLGDTIKIVLAIYTSKYLIKNH